MSKKVDRVVPIWRDWAYAAPLLSVSLLTGPVFILQGIYAKYFGVSLAAISIVLLLSRLFDAIIDPVVGYATDRYQARYGVRWPIIVTGGVIFLVSSWFLYVPVGYDPEAESASSVSAIYFCFWFMAFYLGYTLFEVPHLSWGGDVAVSSIHKNRIYACRSLVATLGALAFYAIPTMPWFETSDFTPATLKVSALASLLLLPIGLYLCVRFVSAQPHRVHSLQQGVRNSSNDPKSKTAFLTVYRSLISNKPYRILTAAYVCTGLGSGFYFTILFFFVDSYLGQGAYLGMATAIGYGISIVSLKLWYEVARRWGKQLALSIALWVFVLALVIGSFLTPSADGWLTLIIFMCATKFGISAFTVLVPSLLSDIVDYARWKYGTENSSTYFSVYTLISKTSSAIGGAVALAIVGWFQFDPTESVLRDSARFGLQLTFLWIPACLFLIGAFFVLNIPIDRRRHEIIFRRLESRKRSGSVDAATLKLRSTTSD